MSNLSRRDEFAKAAMQKMIPELEGRVPTNEIRNIDPANIARRAFRYADALLAAAGEQDKPCPNCESSQYAVRRLEDVIRAGKADNERLVGRVKEEEAKAAALNAELAKYTKPLTQKQVKDIAGNSFDQKDYEQIDDYIGRCDRTIRSVRAERGKE